MASFFKSSTFITLLVVAVVAAGGWWYVSSEEDTLAGVETAPVERQDLERVISETGELVAVSEAALSFSMSGPVAEVLVQEGDEVEAGATLIALEDTVYTARLAQAEANLAREQARLQELQAGEFGTTVTASEARVQAARTRLENAQSNLEKTTGQQNELVNSAEENLYTSNLAAYLTEGSREGTTYDYTSPTITGTYKGREPGEYRLEFYTSNADSGWSVRYSGLESGTIPVSTSQPQALGNNGLYVEFPEDFARGRQIVWTIPIPNTRASGYTSLDNALEQAIDTRDSALQAAENTLAEAEANFEQVQADAGLQGANTKTGQVTIQQAAVRAAEAQVQEALANLDDTQLTAPFAGRVTDIMVEEGEQATAGQVVVEMISGEAFQIEVGVPEVDSAYLSVTDPAVIMFDAVESEVFTGSVVKLSPTARTVDGVQTIEATISVEESLEGFPAGISADVDITTQTRRGVLAVPTRAVYEDVSGERYVYVVDSDTDSLERQVVNAGLRSSGGYTEIIEGLSEGQEVVTFIDEARRDELLDQTNR